MNYSVHCIPSTPRCEQWASAVSATRATSKRNRTDKRTLTSFPIGGAELPDASDDSIALFEICVLLTAECWVQVVIRMHCLRPWAMASVAKGTLDYPDRGILVVNYGVLYTLVFMIVLRLVDARSDELCRAKLEESIDHFWRRSL